MKLTEALSFIKAASKEAKYKRFHIICGFTPLHLETFLRAYLQLKTSDARVVIEKGLYGDIRRTFAELPVGSNAIVFIEWFDLDQRLSARNSVSWSDKICDDIKEAVLYQLGLLEQAIREKAGSSQITIFLPILPLLPIKNCSPREYSSFNLYLKEKIFSFANSISELNTVLIANSDWVHTKLSNNLYDFKSDLNFGFPYPIDVADKLACCAAEIVLPSSVKKGIITDLDNTCWSGILGDDGVDNIFWTQADKAQQHGIYQQLLHSLGDSGILVGIASKNNITAVHEALNLPNMHLKTEHIFPIEANWGRKSESISKIIKAWNISPNDIVFVDDSPLEIEEVKSQYPEMQCFLFPKDNPSEVYDLILELRTIFAVDDANEENKLRAKTLKVNDSIRSILSANEDDFFRTLNASINFSVMESFSKDRCYELVNKTNQFNLNGLRFELSDWLKLNEDPNRFLVQVEYSDKFGDLGRISIISGVKNDASVFIDVWVLSCRAFSRRIEFKSIDLLINKFKFTKIKFLYRKTLKNEPVSIFFDKFEKEITKDEILIDANDFYKNSPKLDW